MYKRKLIYIIIFVLVIFSPSLLISCVNERNDIENIDVVHSLEKTKKEFSVVHIIAEDYPAFEFSFEYYGYFLSDKDYEYKSYDNQSTVGNQLKIFVKNKKSGEAIQTIVVDNVSSFEPEYSYLVDFNFDGFDDILFLNSIQGTHGYFFYSCYIWNDVKREFEEITLDLWGMPNIIVDKERQCILSRTTINAGDAEFSIYKPIEGQLVKTNMLELVGLVEEYIDTENMYMSRFSEYKLIDGQMELIHIYDMDISNNRWKEADSGYFEYIVNGPFGDIFSYDWNKAAAINIEKER